MMKIAVASENDMVTEHFDIVQTLIFLKPKEQNIKKRVIPNSAIDPIFRT